MTTDRTTYLTDIPSPEIQAAVRDATIVWGIGSVEQHGPHLPVSVDFDIANSLSREVAGRVTNGLMAPTQPFGARSLPQSGGGLAFPGTIFITGDILINYLKQIIVGFAGLGCRKLVIVGGHFENEPFVFEAVDMARHERSLGGMSVTAFSWWSLVTQNWIDENVGERFPGWHAEHAGLTETSLMMYLRPSVVNDIRLDHPTPPQSGIYDHPLDLAATTTQGVLSSTVGATAKLGQRLFGHIVDQICLKLESESTLRGEASKQLKLM
ncbi:creatinine amidohydrolase [Neorhizobium sp. 2083]|uniref:creatininase family protein n=1 Tax=Neorhizobium sp. 2083 TaxID=2817762 RepID=UPI0028642070|nr:creatininase family protein [Neorhizobium sp. 2083]MDR6819954.1 creatinine amidohydrolase [Neorhizobium sp. 2083]